MKYDDINTDTFSLSNPTTLVGLKKMQMTKTI